MHHKICFLMKIYPSCYIFVAIYLCNILYFFLRQENLEVKTKAKCWKHIFLILKRYVLIKHDFEPFSSSVIRSLSNVIHDCNCTSRNTFLFSNRKTSDKIKKYSHPLHKTNLHVQDNQKEKISTYFAYSVNLHHHLILFIMFIAQIAVYVIIVKERKNTSRRK